MKGLRANTIKRIMSAMILDADDRRALAQSIIALALLVVAFVSLAAAAGLACNVFDFMRRL